MDHNLRRQVTMCDLGSSHSVSYKATSRKAAFRRSASSSDRMSWSLRVEAAAPMVLEKDLVDYLAWEKMKVKLVD